MKQLEIKTGKATILAVGLPEKDEVSVDGNTLYYGDELSAGEIELPFNCELLGWLDDLTEEQAMSVVVPNDTGNFVGNHRLGDLKFNYHNALDAFKAILKDKGVITVNPLGEEPELSHFYSGDGCFDHDEYYLALTEWQTAQSQLWENVLILVKDGN